MANFVVASGDNIGTASNDVFSLESQNLNFTVDGGAGYDVFRGEDKFVLSGSWSFSNIEELEIFGDGIDSAINLRVSNQKVNLKNTKTTIYLTPLSPDQVVEGGPQTAISVSTSIPASGKVSFNFETGQASGMVLATENGGSVGGTYTGIWGIRAYDTDDTIIGADGYQWAELGRGKNYFDGRGGEDRAIVDGALKHFTLGLDKGGVVTIYDRRLPSDEVTTLVNVEQVYFDGDISPLRDIAIFTGVVNVNEADLKAFIEIYIAYFNRAPDAEGLYYWGTRLSQGMTKEKIAESFYVQKETQALYTNPDDTEGFVTAVYNNFLGRAPDAEGFAYWVNELNSGAISKPIFLLAIINGAKAASGNPNDVAYFSDKVKIGTYFAVTKGMSNVENAKAVMALYDGSAASLAAAKNQTDTFYASAADAHNGEALMQVVGLVDDPFAV